MKNRYGVLRIVTYIEAESETLCIAGKTFAEACTATYCAIDNHTPIIRNVSHFNMRPTKPQPSGGVDPDWLQIASKRLHAGFPSKDTHAVYRFLALDVLKEVWRWPEVQAEAELRDLVRQACHNIFPDKQPSKRQL